jgi:hypothetical protein
VKGILSVDIELGGSGDASRLARRAAWASAGLTVAFLVALVVTPLLGPLPLEWRGAADYAATFSPATMFSFVPPLFLAPVFVVLAAALRSAARTRSATTALSAGVAFAAIYAAIISTNDLVQLTTVRASLERGLVDGLDPFVWTNPYGLFAPLELLGYAFQALAGLAFLAVFDGASRGDAWIRRLLVSNGVLAGASFGIVVFDVPWLIFPGLIAWSIVFGAAMALIARRLGRTPA